ncbi:hypothetical protein [Halomonas alkalisoli]|uniref:hypothetical protein n=1 Tax=Halomonas alkalisoli TaxID=2907158 RepID=UPI001F2EE647|nr:hypothetical protein [Halomonas alkalisoli]MCE9683702.1 hypothetical protein [Halomonas alkalisoli]
MLMGADLSGLLWARLGFALVVIALLAKLPWLKRAQLPAWMFASRAVAGSALRSEGWSDVSPPMSRALAGR